MFEYENEGVHSIPFDECSDEMSVSDSQIQIYSSCSR